MAAGTITRKESLQAGHWHLARLKVAAGKATLFLKSQQRRDGRDPD
jgi:hypothetical protein